jgi:DNA-binding response OmpR family regulator
MRILIVEDDYKIANAVKRGLEQQSYAVDVVYDADDALQRIESAVYDLIILDRMLPGSTDGIGIVSQMRSAKNFAPVLLLTAKDRVLDKAHGLNAGADDYLVKPFAFVELIARVRALLRRPKQAVPQVLSYDSLMLDTENMKAFRNDTPLQLSAKEFALVEFFMRNTGITLSKERIMQHVWDYDADILPNTVEVYIGYVRNKIDKAFPLLPALIHTRRGFGYVMEVSDDV